MIDKLRDEVARPAVALDDAAHRASALKPRHLEGDFGAGAGAADEDADAESAQGIHREPEDLRDGRGLEREMRAATGDLADLGEGFPTLALQDMRRAELARESKAGRQAVDRNDRVAAGDPCRHETGETDAANAVDRDRLALD